MIKIKKSTKSTTQRSTQSRKKPRNKKRRDLPKIIIGFVVLLALFSLYIAYRIVITKQPLISLSFLALCLGIAYESHQINKNYLENCFYLGAAYLVSLSSFLPSKHEDYYNFDHHLESWFYFLILCYLIIFTLAQRSKVIAQLTESNALVVSLCFIYWLIEIQLFYVKNSLVVLLPFSAVCFALFCLMHAFLKIPLTQNNRFIMSLGTSIIVSILSVTHFFQIFQNVDISIADPWQNIFLAAFQSFLLGISTIYLIQNLLLLVEFLPSRSSTDYSAELKQAFEQHTERFSVQQSSYLYALFCCILPICLFSINLIVQFFNPLMMVWLVIFTIQLLTRLFKKYAQYSSKNSFFRLN